VARPCPKHKDYEDVLRRHITKFSDTTLEEIQGLTCRRARREGQARAAFGTR